MGFIMRPSRHLRLLVEFLKFGTVGGLGFIVDTATVYALRDPLGLYAAGVVSYVFAASTTWVFNRLWTFRGAGRGPAHHQWLRFLIANFCGFVLNRGTFAVLVTISTLCTEEPVFAVAAGTLAGMFLNFALSRRYVFRD